MDALRLHRVLDLARCDTWTLDIPMVPAAVRIAVNSLQAQRPNFWGDTPEELQALLTENPGVEQIFKNNNDEVLAFAIRDARL